MIQLPEDRRPPLTPQLALRVAVVGSIALAMFAIIFFRLWFLQVLSGDQYLAQASVNRVRNVDIPASRGEMLDRSGNSLVDSKRTIAVQIAPPDLPVPLQSRSLAHPPAKDASVYNRLAAVLGMPTARKRCQVPGHGVVRLSPIGCEVAQSFALLPYANVTISKDVDKNILLYLEERQYQFPGVRVQPVWLRKYPLRSLAAQLFGTIGPISTQELKYRRFRGVPQDALVGQSGLGWAAHQSLRGPGGVDRARVDSRRALRGYLLRHSR